MGACDIMLSGMGQGKKQQAEQVARQLTPHPTCSSQKHVQCSGTALLCHVKKPPLRQTARVSIIIWPSNTAAFSCSGNLGLVLTLQVPQAALCVVMGWQDSP